MVQFIGLICYLHRLKLIVLVSTEWVLSTMVLLPTTTRTGSRNSAGVVIFRSERKARGDLDLLAHRLRFPPLVP